MSNNDYERQQFWDKELTEKNSDKYTFTNYDAIGICEGYIEEYNEEKIIAAWQHLVDTGLAWSLQGWFGRQAAIMIDEGIIKPKLKSNVDNN